jgi:hypothetical protein
MDGSICKIDLIYRLDKKRMVPKNSGCVLFLLEMMGGEAQGMNTPLSPPFSQPGTTTPSGVPPMAGALPCTARFLSARRTPSRCRTCPPTPCLERLPPHSLCECLVPRSEVWSPSQSDACWHPCSAPAASRSTRLLTVAPLSPQYGPLGPIAGVSAGVSALSCEAGWPRGRS